MRETYTGSVMKIKLSLAQFERPLLFAFLEGVRGVLIRHDVEVIEVDPWIPKDGEYDAARE